MACAAIDIDECKLNQHDCNPDEFEDCNNTYRSYECVCQKGYHNASGTCEGEYITWPLLRHGHAVYNIGKLLQILMSVVTPPSVAPTLRVLTWSQDMAVPVILDMNIVPVNSYVMVQCSRVHTTVM